LRAIAVLSVVIFHVFPEWLSGGYVGVDIFFVISGFLISNVIIGNLQRDNFSFIDFYSRRIRRIFPALIIVLLTSIIFGWFALLASEYKQLGKHIVGGASFASNFLFWREAGYFDNDAVTKPLLHLWSLGIEEQFYILWPLLLWLAWKKFNLLVAIVTVAIISFALNINTSSNDAVAAFYSPQTRFWELLTGAILAQLSLQTKKRATADVALCNIQALLGAVLIVIGLTIINKSRHFPGWWVLLPTSGAALIIASGAQAWLNRVVLSNGVMVWFGLISYPLYLWHWPLLSFIRIMQGAVPSWETRVAVVLLSIALAWLTYRWVESPIRQGSKTKTKTVALLILMMIVGGLGYSVFVHGGFISRHPQAEAVNARLAWPERMNFSQDCVSRFGQQYAPYCRVDNSSAPSEIMLIGDSAANHFFPGLNAATKGKNLLNLGRGACLPFLGVNTRRYQIDLECQEVMADALTLAANTSEVKTVVLAMMGSAYIKKYIKLQGGEFELHSLDDPGQRDTRIIFESAMRKTLDLLTGANKNVIFVVSVPTLDFDPDTCVDRRPLYLMKKTLTSPCAMSRENFEESSHIYRELVFRVLQDYPDVKVFDAATALCDKNYCWAMKDNQLLYRDRIHLTLQGSEYMATKLAEMIRP
jgi:peptidoglycan/LPS O-acetylase OafA/YrhL